METGPVLSVRRSSITAMLEELHIRALGVIEDAVLELSPGLTVLTGETGAGKTMVVTSLGLLFGGRADPGVVRPGARHAVVEGRLVTAHDSPARGRALEAGAEIDDDVLLCSRTVAAEGRGRAHVGGRAVPVAVLGELADDAIAIHGQSDQQRLLRPARQRAALDRFAGDAVLEPLATYTETFARVRAVERELEHITTRARERAQEADLLRFGLDEVEAVAPRSGEDEELRAEEARLAHADALRIAATRAHDALTGAAADDGGSAGQDALTAVTTARRLLDAARDHDPDLGTMADRLAEVGFVLADAAGELASYSSGVDTDPARLAAVQERRAALTRLTRKYGGTVDQVLDWAGGAARRLAELDDDDGRIEFLRIEREGLRTRLADLADRTSTGRQHAARRFADAVSAELAALAMPQAQVSVSVEQALDGDGLELADGRRVAFGAHGIDEVELRLAPHPGAPPRPLQRGASGGELSRVMLAVEVVFAGADPVPTFVFDEVDAGVGGKAAVEVGRRLSRLAQNAQVLVVTHLPQVAAFADRHLVIRKSSTGTVTSSGVLALDDAGRVAELSRMLAGLEGSQTAVAHAEELLATARKRGGAVGGGGGAAGRGGGAVGGGGGATAGDGGATAGDGGAPRSRGRAAVAASRSSRAARP